MKLKDLLSHLTWGTNIEILLFEEKTEKTKKIFTGFSNDAINNENQRNKEVLTIYLDIDTRSLIITITE